MKPTKRFARKEIERLIWPIVEQLDQANITFEICGSYRRGRPDSKDVDILIQTVSLNAFKIPEMMKQFHGPDVRWQGEKKMSFFYGELPIDIKAVSEEHWGAGLLHHTGNDIFNMVCRSRVKKKGFLLNEYGIWTREEKVTDRRKIGSSKTEVDILDFIFDDDKVVARFLDPKARQLEPWPEKK